ncbi:hypothetical protein CP533_4942 [Ophiocordyceps camponoti-saundersi (nom. inval.)]|nr:hypothetical protein CP533_4942 [Ophiocordyceps camponoti-saundersi (nom. inval.)]
MSCPLTISTSLRKFGFDRGALIAPESVGSPQHHVGASSSSVAETQETSVSDIDQTHRRKLEYRNAPKLDRTMTDVYGDELYSPNFTITSTPAPQDRSEASPGNPVFSQRINAANSQHLNAAHSPVSAPRNFSPFRTCSSYASAVSHDKWTSRDNSRRRTEEGNTRKEASATTHPTAAALIDIENEPETPKTISPKDAVLEYSETDTDCNFPLFPQDAATFTIDPTVKSFMSSLTNDYRDPETCQVLEPRKHLNLHISHLMSDLHTPAHYSSLSGIRSGNHTPPRLSSSRSNSVTSEKTPSSSPTEVSKPTPCSADTGTYTCTYHGCRQRFGTPLLLQKHKREGHRQAQGSCVTSDAGTALALLNTQAGPHRCDRINPSTGKSCNTIFSRPYDLTRHEDTIHNARKQKVRCDLCTEEKTFSRADALTRHYRVCHPDIDLPGSKHKRRGAS